MSAGNKELRFYIANASEVNKRYRGKHIAIVRDKVVAAGKSVKEVKEKAEKKGLSEYAFFLVPRSSAIFAPFGA